MFAISSTKGGIPEKPVVLERMPPLVLYEQNKKRMFSWYKILKCFSWY